MIQFLPLIVLKSLTYFSDYVEACRPTGLVKDVITGFYYCSLKLYCKMQILGLAGLAQQWWVGPLPL